MVQTKLIKVLALTGACALSITACGNGATEGAAQGDDLTLRFGHSYEPTHAVETCGVPALQESLEGTGITVESYSASQLGSEAEMLEQVAGGSLDLSTAGAAFLGTWHEPIGVLDAAYLFDDVDHFQRILESDVMDDAFEQLAEQSGLEVQTGMYYGTRQVTSNTPITQPEDLEGVKIRTPDAEILLQNIQYMGGTATPMALNEVYLGLQQGVIDAQENPLPTIETSNFQEVQEYLNITDHMVQGIYLLSSTSFSEQLTDEQQPKFETALDNFSSAITECILDEEAQIIDEWESEGSIEINSDVNVSSISESVQAEFEDHPIYGDLYQEIRNY